MNRNRNKNCRKELVYWNSKDQILKIMILIKTIFLKKNLRFYQMNETNKKKSFLSYKIEFKNYKEIFKIVLKVMKL